MVSNNITRGTKLTVWTSIKVITVGKNNPKSIVEIVKSPMSKMMAQQVIARQLNPTASKMFLVLLYNPRVFICTRPEIKPSTAKPAIQYHAGTTGTN